MPNIKLSKLQKDVLSFFGDSPFAKNFYWTGGTLLSYCYLNHRYSLDLDFFSENLFTDDEYLLFINQLKKRVKADKVTLTLQYNRRLYLIERKNEAVKLELVYFPFPAIEKRKELTEFSIKIDSLSDIITNKALSIYQRNEVKDVYDLYIYLTLRVSSKSRHNLLEFVKLVEKKFGVAIEPLILLAKINELANQLDSLTPFLFHKIPSTIPQKNLKKRVISFFQDIFNSIAKKQIK